MNLDKPNLVKKKNQTNKKRKERKKRKEYNIRKVQVIRSNKAAIHERDWVLAEAAEKWLTKW